MTTQTSISPRAWAEMALLALIWGASFLSIRVALDEVPVLTVVAFRVGGAAAVLWLYVLARGLPVPRGLRLWGVFAVRGLLNNILPFSLITWGQLHIASGLASILNAATAIFGVAIAALVFADERLTFRKGLGVLLGFLGVATAVGLQNLTRFDLTSMAQWALIGASLCYGLSSSWARAFLKGVTPQVATAGMLTMSALVMIPLALWQDGAPPLGYSPAAWSALAYLALAASATAYLLYYRVLAAAGAGNLSFVTLLVSPVAILLGALVLGEQLRPQAYFGFALLALGLVILDGRAWSRLRQNLRPVQDPPSAG